MRTKILIVTGLALAAGTVLLAAALRLSDYDRHYRTIGRRLTELPGVKIIGTWRHEDVTLEDFGFAIRVRDCAPVRLDFYESHEWEGLFDGIDGVVVWSGDGLRDGKVVSSERLSTRGPKVTNLSHLVTNMETVLAIVDAEPGAGTTWPSPHGDYVVMRYPVDGILPRIDARCDWPLPGAADVGPPSPQRR